jgi:predicted Kef-type K+ transport protein
MDIMFLLVAFGFGLIAKYCKLPPLIGFLIAGFFLNALGYSNNETLQAIANMGITIMLFTIGLKLNIKDLLKREILLGSIAHSCVWIALCSAAVFALGLFVATSWFTLTWNTAVLIGFAFSFSSTVCVVKILDEAGEIKTRHGKLAIGILVMQDIFAVLFLVVATGKIPLPWAALLVLLIPARPLLQRLLSGSGHGEMLPLTGFIFALGAYHLFELVGIKGDFGALIAGVLLASQAKSAELSKSLMAFKDLFLIGFFLTIGLTALPSIELVSIALILCLLLPLKFLLFFGLFISLRLRARTAYLTSLMISNYSEFGLIVGAVAVAGGMLEMEWLVILALATAFSFIVTSVLYKHSHHYYCKHKNHIKQYEHPIPLHQDIYPSLGDAKVLVIGMGRVGKGAFKAIHAQLGQQVCGIDSDPDKINKLAKLGKNAIVGDGEDIDLWENLNIQNIELVLIALPSIEDASNITQQLKSTNFNGRIAAIARYEDEVEPLINNGVDRVFNFFTEAGLGFAEESLLWAKVCSESKQ